MVDTTAPAAASHAGSAPAAPAGEGCPTPLAWADVLAAFREQRDEFALPTSWGDVQLWEFGAGPPLVFLGDAAGDGDLFALVAWLLREERRCLLLTLPDVPRGVRRESWLPGWAQLVQQTLAARQVESAPVVATGSGGVIALQTALDFPTQVSRLILQGTIPAVHWTRFERLALSLGVRCPGTLGRVPTWRRIAEENHRRWFPPFDGTRWEFLRDNLAHTPIQRFSRRMLAAGETRMTARLGDVNQPTLIIRTEGEGARATVAQEQLAEALPQSRVEWMHTTGWYPHVTHPHRLVKLIREFVNEPATAPARSTTASEPQHS